MTIRSIALLAICVAAFLRAAGVAGPALSIYYSFDAPASAALVTEMQAEVDRILADAGVRVAWRALESPRNGEDFQGVVFLRFRGICSEDPVLVAGSSQREYSGQSLGRTDIEDGHVLPFGTVDCDKLQRFVGPVLNAPGGEEKSVRLGRAIARVSAHEIYHMLTASEEHARRGIARASLSRADLVAPTFAFGQAQARWLRAWAAASSGRADDVAAAAGLRTSPAQDGIEQAGADVSAGR
jgi:hypothetical protein